MGKGCDQIKGVTPAVLENEPKKTPRDRHREIVNRTRPEGVGCGRKLGRRPTLDDYDNR